MLYITGLQALNLNCSLSTSGDWHQSAISWRNLDLCESDCSFYKNYGIEIYNHVPGHVGTFYVANHLRAILDLLLRQEFSILQGMREDFIGTDEYDDEFLELVYHMRVLWFWPAIDRFMEKEYLFKWAVFKEIKENG